MTIRRFWNLLLGLPRTTVFWRLVEKEPARVEGPAARNLLRDL